MTRPSLPLPSVFVVLCLLAQGALLYYTGRWAEAPHLLLLLLFCGLAVAAGAAALWSWRQGAGHRPRLWVLLTMELSLLLAAGASISVGDEESEAWVAEAQANAPLCGCGCGEVIEVKAPHRSKGLPTYRPGHGPGPYTALIAEANAEGLLTIAQAAERMGRSENYVRRRAHRGEYEVVTRQWGRRRVTLVRLEAVD